MDTSEHSGNNKKSTVLSERPVDIKDWSRDHVRQWLLEIKVDEEDAEILYKQKIKGDSLLLLEETDLKAEGLSLNARKLIIKKIGLLKKQPPCSKPYPFNRYNVGYRYRENSILGVTETGPKDFIQPCHEFKDFTNTPEEKRMSKFTYEVIRFAAACMNSRTNGTIHFGVADKPHGQILGVSVQNTDDFDKQQSDAIKTHFNWERYVKIAKRCIKPPRFVEVLKADMTFAGKYVIEVDIEPSSIMCEEFHFNTYNVDINEDEKKKKKKKKRRLRGDESFFIRDGSSTRSLITSASSKEYEKYTETASMQRLSQMRKDAEEKHLSVVKNSVQGSKLCEMITGGTQSMDRSYFTSYIVVANKSHPVQLENLEFLLHMDIVAVLDFDPESAKSGLNKMLGEKKMSNAHLPAQYKITGAVEDIANRLKLTKNTSWVFCNGGIHGETPSDADHWLTEKGSSVRDVVSFLCRQYVLPRKKLLTIFLLLSQVSEGNVPLLETFSMFLQELNGQNQILCISDNETTYNYWKDLINGRYKVDISTRCIYELSFAEVNGTVLSLWSENRKSSRFLSCGGGSKVELSKKTEESLDMLSILCVNECEGGNEDKQKHEENFYKGGKVSWWNFYYSEQPGSMPFIKRDKFDYVVDTIIPDILNRKRACEFFNIFHLPGCGGSTLAMHVLWTLKDKFRCAVLKDTTDDYPTVAKQVVQLLTYETEEKTTQLPVLLMIDDFQDICEVKKLQDQIEKCLKQNIFFSPQVIIVNCMRVESCEQAKKPDDTVFIGNILSVKEKKQIKEKLKEIEVTYENAKEFHGIKNLHVNFSSEYIQGIVKKSLRGFDFKHKHAQLFAVLVLLHVYCNNASLSVSTCEEFLGLQTKADSESCKVEDGFEMLSSLLTRCIIASKVTFEGMRVIHSSIAQHCLKELSTSHGVSKAKITNLLLTTESFYDNALGKQKLKQDVRNMLVRRQHSAEVEDTFFSPLIQDIMKETPGKVAAVLVNADIRYTKDAVIYQLLARYYIKQPNFEEAMNWAKKAKDLSRDNSNICNTVSEVLLHELNHAVDKDRDDPIKPDSLDKYLTLADSAAKACKETQQTAEKEAMARLQRLKDNTYNTAGHLGELQAVSTVIQKLQKIPFNPDFTSNNHLTQVLLGELTIEDLSRDNPELKQYCDVLQKHMSFILQLKHKMKQNLLFFDKMFDNLSLFSVGNDKQKELTVSTVFMYFQQYIGIFYKINWSELVNKGQINTMIKIEMCQCLERNTGDSNSSLLEYLYEKDSTLEEYDFILKSHPLLGYCNCNTSQFYCYSKAVHKLPTFVSQMKMSYSNELKPVSWK